MRWPDPSGVSVIPIPFLLIFGQFDGRCGLCVYGPGRLRVGLTAGLFRVTGQLADATGDFACLVFWATVYKTVGPVLSVRCLSVCDVRAL